MTLLAHFRSIHQHNATSLRHNALSELSGSLGDLGTLLPLMIAMAHQGSIDLPSTLVFSGLANIVTGAAYGLPLPVQPMKAIASVAISQHFTKDQTAAAGLTMGITVLLLSVTGSLRWLNRVVPIPVVKGIQVGAGLNLITSAGTSLIMPLAWSFPSTDNRLWAIAAFILLLLSSRLSRLPFALLVMILGLVTTSSLYAADTSLSLWTPRYLLPSYDAWKVGAIYGALPQLPLTTLNSVLAVVSLATSLFPDDLLPMPLTTSIGLSVAMTNLVGCWFGAMPMCHGSGGLAAQYRFGARSGASVIMLGLIKLSLGLFVGDGIMPVLQSFPNSLLGVMVLAAGVELAKVGNNIADMSELWTRVGSQDEENGLAIETKRQQIKEENQQRAMVMLVTASCYAAFKNDAIGFVAGLSWHFVPLSMAWLGRCWPARRQRSSHGAIRLNDGQDVA